MAELKIEIEKLEKDIKGYQKRIIRLEKYLVKNGIKVPDDSYDSEALQKIDSSIENKENVEDQFKKLILNLEDANFEIKTLQENINNKVLV